MKVHAEFFDLVFIMVFIIAGTPLLISLVLTCDKSEFRYLDDKTVYTMGSIVDYKYSESTGTYVPVNLAPLRLDLGGAQLIALIQDDYCPENGMTVNWKLTANRPDGTNNGVAVDPIRISASVPDTLVITRGWYTKRADVLKSLHDNVSGPMKAAGANGPFYLVWDYKRDCWMITHEFINIFEEN